MPSVTKVPLKYLFNVTYKDGSSFLQPENDTSSTDPQRSAYYDVKQDEVEWFHLVDWHGTGLPIAWVNVQTGEVYARPEGRRKLGGSAPYKLIFWRQHTHNFNVGMDELSHEVRYVLGYSDANGKEHTIVIE